MRVGFFHILEYGELDGLVNKELIHSEKDVFECVPFWEWNNDTACVCENIKKNPEYDDVYSRQNIENLINDGVTEYFGFGTHALLTYLCQKNIIPEGNYIINVSW